MSQIAPTQPAPQIFENSDFFFDVARFVVVKNDLIMVGDPGSNPGKGWQTKWKTCWHI